MADHYETEEQVQRSSPVEIQQLLENSNTQGETEMDRLSNQLPTEISIEMEKWFSSIAASSHPSEQPSRSKPRIQKVPHLLKSIESNAKCFEPLIISLGPIHSKSPHLQRMEKLKASFMHQFASDCNVSYQDLYDKVASVLNEAKDCYEASIIEEINDKSFCQMMCLDGCFILQFVCMFTSDELKINKTMKINDILQVRRDLFLLENQIPFVILHALMSLRINNNKDDLEELFFKFIDMDPLPRDVKERLKKMRIFRKLIYQAINIVGKYGNPIYLLDIVRTLSIKEYEESERGTENTEWSSYRSVKELKTAGVHFRMAKSPHFTKVRFKNNMLSSGTLFIPPLSVDYYTKSKLLNMAAYEACPDATSDLEVTSYICFMDELIDQADDVKVLRSEGILFNQIGSDQLVADLFNEIANGLVPNPKIYNTVRHQIENHYKQKMYVWIAQWTHKYLSTPWTVIGLLAGVMIIMLTVVQTWFTVFPRQK